MRKTGTLLFASLVLAWATTGSLVAQSTPKLQPVAQTEHNEGKEDHPHIEAAIKALENAKHQLETAAHDFQGHRSKALDHVNQALEECHDALRADKK